MSYLVESKGGGGDKKSSFLQSENFLYNNKFGLINHIVTMIIIPNISSFFIVITYTYNSFISATIPIGHLK